MVAGSGARLGWLDYLLTAIGSMLAVYSAGMSIDTPAIGYFCGALIILGTLCSYGIRVLAGSSKLIRADGPIYAIAAIGAIVGAPALMTLLPSGGFPLQMAAAGGLCWMLVFGSFLSWGDSTLLFQAVPGIALFGLVGCYDTYRNVVFAFFGFLICLCTGFARAHGREMLRRAAESGYFDRAGIRFDPSAPEQSAELFDTIKKGPWRWVAGPEWALISALAIVLISLAGAPVIQSSVQGVAGFASIKMPVTKRNAAVSQALNQENTGSANIGQGPVTGLSGQPIYEAKLDRPRYLRLHSFIAYNGRGWTSRTGLSLDVLQAISDMALSQIKNPVTIDFQISPRVVTRFFALPGEFDMTDVTDARLFVNPDGGYESAEPIEIGHFLSGRSLEAKDPSDSLTTLHPMPSILQPYLDTQHEDQQVKDLALQVIKDGKNDREKAEAIMRSIAQHAKYNANVAATPPGADPVAHFLFDAKEGYCDVFASSMVLMARNAGIPARFVTGYLPEDQDSIDGLFIVRDKDYHAWAELFFKDVGWVVYDPTSIATMAEGGEVKVRSAGSLGAFWLTALLDGAIFGLLGGGVWLIMRARKKGPATETDRRDEVDDIYVSYARTLRSFTGRRRLLSETPSEYLAQTKVALNGAYDKAELLTRKFELLLYAPGNPTPDTVAELRSELRELKQMLRAEKKARKSPTPTEESTPSP